MNTERDNVKAALIEVTGGSRRNKTARLRDYYDWVMEAKAAGASNKVLVNALAKNGLIFDIDTFKHALHRLKKERAMEALVKTASAHIERRSSGSLNKPQVDNDITNTGTSTVKLTTQIPPESADKLEQEVGVEALYENNTPRLTEKQKREKFADKYVGGNSLLDSIIKKEKGNE